MIITIVFVTEISIICSVQYFNFPAIFVSSFFLAKVLREITFLILLLFFELKKKGIINKMSEMITNNLRRGAFILFEGCDKSGKTTQSRKLGYLIQNNKRRKIK